MNSSTYIFKLL